MIMVGNAFIRLLESSDTAVLLALIVCIIIGAILHMLTLKATRGTGGGQRHGKKNK